MALDKFHVVRFTQRRLMNPMVRGVLVRGWRIPGYALLETTGRTSGRLNDVAVRSLGTDLLSVRIELEPLS